MSFPESLISIALEPKTKADRERLDQPCPPAEDDHGGRAALVRVPRNPGPFRDGHAVCRSPTRMSGEPIVPTERPTSWTASGRQSCVSQGPVSCLQLCAWRAQPASQV